jgi:uncharacterized protein
MRQCDLVWTVQSQTPLLSRDDFTITTESEIDLANIPDLTRSYSRRLGKYFEDLIEQWLLGREEITNLHRSIQIFENEITLGECDFLFLRHGKPIHWEVSVKFYLLMPDGRFWGPNFSDRLDIKVDRLISHQLPLIHREEAKRQIPEEFRSGTKSEVFFKGQLFYPYGQERKTLHGINPAHEWGYWITHNSAEYHDFFSERKGDAFQIVPKMRWLAPVKTEGVELLLPYSSLSKTLQDHFAKSDNSLMISRLVKKNETWEEIERFFVIHKYLPMGQN